MGISKKTYETVINVLGEGDYDTYKKIVMNLAKYYPHIFIQMLDDTDHVIRGLISEGKKMQAVKIYRDKTSCTLKEAKAKVDNIKETMGGI